MDSELNSLLMQAKSEIHQKNYANAHALLEEIIESGGNSAEAYYLMGSLLNTQKKFSHSVQAFKKAIEIDPSHTDAAIALSILYNDLGRYEEGQKIFNLANQSIKERSQVKDLHIDRIFSGKHRELGELYVRYQRYDEALFEFEKAIALDPSQLEIRVKTAKVLSKKGFQTRAFQELKKLKREHPDFLPGRIALGLLYYSEGNVVDAQSEWEWVLFKEPQNEEAALYLRVALKATETRV